MAPTEIRPKRKVVGKSNERVLSGTNVEDGVIDEGLK